ncbi:MAG: hypothetical protein HY216_15495, partial [Candidatus Rokubacteria bacterium]|nr:hypothetical protein [Candidatus Rokubacteria bacterium]
ARLPTLPDKPHLVRGDCDEGGGALRFGRARAERAHAAMRRKSQPRRHAVLRERGDDERVGVALGLAPPAIAEALGAVGAVPGRFEQVRAGQPFLVIVDYAHTPDALERVLTTARKITTGRLAVVFGCGGDRDRMKRPIMGALAARLTDRAWVTSDNPRSEDPRAIVDEVLAGARDGRGVTSAEPDRHAAIAAALAWARPGDTVMIAGKGHETYQIVGSDVRPFDDREVARRLLTERA